MFRLFKYTLCAGIAAIILAGCGDSLTPQEKLNAAVDAAQNNRWDEVNEICGSLLEQQPACVDAITLKAVALARLNRYPEAVSEIRRAVELDPASFPAQYMAGWLAAKESGREAQAMDRLTVALRLQPTDPNTLMMLAALGGKLNDDTTSLYLDMLPPADKTRPEALNLRGVQIHSQHTVCARHGQQVGHQLGGDGVAALGLAVLARVAEVGNDGGDSSRARTAHGVDHDEQLHEVVVDRLAGGLYYKHVGAAYGLSQAEGYFSVGKGGHRAVAELLAQLLADCLRKFGVGVTGEHLYLFPV